MLWNICFVFEQILEVNGQNFENVQLTKANEILRNNTHLSISVKTNLLGENFEGKLTMNVILY